MSNKLSLILISLFVVALFAFGTDLVLIQSIYSTLDSISDTVSYKIANYGITSEGEIDNSIVNYVYEKTGANLIKKEDSKTQYLEGDTFTFVLYKKYEPLFISSNEISIDIERYAIIGANHA